MLPEDTKEEEEEAPRPGTKITPTPRVTTLRRERSHEDTKDEARKQKVKDKRRQKRREKAQARRVKVEERTKRSKSPVGPKRGSIRDPLEPPARKEKNAA